MSVGFSVWLAMILGVLIPLQGIVGNWTQEKPDPGSFFADLVCGAFLLFGAFKTRQKERTGRRFLSAAWGLTLGLLYSNLMVQLTPVEVRTIVETPIPAEVVTLVTILGVLIALIGLISSLRSTRPK